MMNYLEIDPKEASLIELIRLLCSSDLENRSFIDCSEKHVGKALDFQRRWLIFFSVLSQMSLLHLKKPMALIGQILLWWLNLVSYNGGLFNFVFIKLFSGKVVKPDRRCSEFASLIGNLDTRIELDNNIKPDDDDKRYKSSLAVMAAKLSYENQAFVKNVVLNHWKMQFLEFDNFWNGYQETPSTQAFMFIDTWSDPELIVVAFRGTDPFDADAWRTDLDISWFELPNVGKIHSGFVKALGLQPNNTWPNQIQQNPSKKYAYFSIKEALKLKLQKNDKAKFIVTGHSLGGALAVLFVAGLAIHEESFLMDKLEGIYTFGQPRVGDEKFGNFMKRKFDKFNVRYLRYVYCNDLVPRIPHDDKTLLFKHFGPCLYYNSLYKGMVLGEEPNKNYSSLMWLIPKYLNAFWELFRGFIIPYVKGKEYKEGWFLKMFRMVGLVIPGLAAHGPQDYVNLTRLGPLLTPSNPIQSETDSKVK